MINSKILADIIRDFPDATNITIRGISDTNVSLETDCCVPDTWRLLAGPTYDNPMGRKRVTTWFDPAGRQSRIGPWKL